MLSSPNREEQGRVDQAARILAEQGLVIVPTETVYGIACLAHSERACQRIYQLKGRPGDKPFSWHVSGWEQVNRELDHKGWSVAKKSLVKKLTDHFWPGPLTLVIGVNQEQTVGLRCPDHAVFQAVAGQLERPLIATSANLSGQKSPASIADIDPVLIQGVDLVLDAGPTGYGQDSTVLDVSRSPAQILRQGVISKEEIEQVLGASVLDPSGTS